MALIHNSSAYALHSALDCFGVPPSNISTDNGYYQVIYPISSVEDATTVEIVVTASGDDYLDVGHTLVYVQGKIVKISGADLTEADNADVGPTNYFLHSMWKQVDTELNGTLVSQASTNYHYRSYMEACLGYDYPAKVSHLTSRMWYKDQAGAMDSLTTNSGLVSRRGIAGNSKTFEMMGALHGDIFNQDRFILNNVEMRLRFHKNSSAFMLMSGSNERFKITKMYLMVRKVLPSPSVRLGHAEALMVSSAKYPVRRTDVKTVSITAGLQDKSIDNLYLGTVPQRITLGFVDNKAYNGDFKLNGFNFQHFNVNYLSLHVDSRQFPAKPFTPDFENGEYIEAFSSLFSGTGIHFKDEGNFISRTDYPNGYCFYVFDLTHDLSANEGYWSPQRQGTVRLDVRFKQPLAQAINCVIMAEFNNLIEIDRHRNVIVDFSS